MVTETLAYSDSDTASKSDDSYPDEFFKLFSETDSDECSIEEIVESQIEFRQKAGQDDNIRIQVIQNNTREENTTRTSSEEMDSRLIKLAQFFFNMGVSMACFADYVSRKICRDQIPTPGPILANMLAFFPPSPWEYYYLSYENDNGERNYGDAKICFNKKKLKIEPVIYSKNIDRVRRIVATLMNTQAFIIHSKSGNYIVGCKISAVKERRKSYHKVLLVAGINAVDIGVQIIGQAGLIGTRQHPAEYDVYLFDYSGYGLSSGKPTEKNIYHDIHSVYEYIIKERNDPKLKIILLGASIGTAPTTDLASKNLPHVAGLVLVAPLTSALRHISSHQKNPSPLKKTSTKVDSFRILDKAPLIKVPVLCMHGLNDSMMPPTNSIQISEAAPKGLQPLLLEGEEHTSLLENPHLRMRLIQFIEKDIEQ